MASTLRRAVAAVTALTGRARKPRYQSLSTEQEEFDDGQQTPTDNVRKAAKRNRLRRDLILFAIAIIGVGLLAYATMDPSEEETECDSLDKGYHCKTKDSRFWGQYSPYFSVKSEISADVPDQCQITFAQILSRHGARHPTAGKTERYHKTIDHIHNTAQRYPGKYAFLKKYEYKLEADQLTAFGEQELVNSGMKYYRRYQALAKDIVPFVRSAGQERVVQSAQKWAQGFHDARAADEAASTPDGYPYNIVVIDEGAASNSTLSHDTCTNYETNMAEEAQKAWAAIFTPTLVKRINRSLRGSFLYWEHVIDLMDLCPFETVQAPDGRISLFCVFFSATEWQDYDYYQTLGKYYGYSSGNPLGATQGVGYVNELIARMTDNPVEDHTNTNSTLDGSNETFPVGGNAKLFADFSHDNDISGVFAALGLYNATKAPSTTIRQTAEELGGFSASWTVPFAARAYFEKMKCAGQDEEYVRIIVNDRVIPLETCGGDSLGRCTLSKFVDSLSFARGGGDWDNCFV